MESYRGVNILFLAYIITRVIGLAQSQFSTQYCVNTTGNYTSNSTYKTNLNIVLNSLTSNKMITSGFYNFSGGQIPDKVNAIGLCRGDVETDSCRTCLNKSSRNLQQICPTEKEAIGWNDNCMLRYSDRSIYGEMETLPNAYAYNINNASNFVQFNSVVRKLLESLRGVAARGGPVTKFATGNMSVGSDNTMIYGLVQCTPDLSERQCNECLNFTFRALPKCCDGKIGGRVLTPNCHFRYEIGRFYNAPAPPPADVTAPLPADDTIPPSADVTAPPPDATTPPPGHASGKGARNKESLIALSAITTVVTTILFC